MLNRRLAEREYVAGEYSIADMAIVGWAKMWERQGQTIEDFPNVKRWLDTMLARPAVERGLKVSSEIRNPSDMQDPAVQAMLFNQRAR